MATLEDEIPILLLNGAVTALLNAFQTLPQLLAMYQDQLPPLQRRTLETASITVHRELGKLLDVLRPSLQPLVSEPLHPELDKILAIQDKTKFAIKFLEWLQLQHKTTLYMSTGLNKEPLPPPYDQLLAEFAGINLAKAQQERKELELYVQQQQADSVTV
jgi:hypothetical protein